jgi:dihydrofolate reductase
MQTGAIYKRNFMNLIVAVDEKWGIGCNNKLLASVPGDMAYFKEKTMDKVVVMGRKTLESLPGGRGLQRRVNFVLTSRKDFEAERCIIVNSEKELESRLAEFAPDDVFVIGGESIYRMFYEKCDKLYVTKLYADLGADAFMVDLDEDDRFEVTWESDLKCENGIYYRFTTYEKVSEESV